MRRAGQWLFLLAIAWAVLLDGAVELWALVPAAFASGVAAVLLGWDAEPKQPRRAASILFWLGASLTAYTALQAMPLPAGLVHALSPHAADVWARALRPLDVPGPAWHPLSLDPGATRVQVLRGATYLATLFAALSMARVPSERALLERALVALAVLVAVATVAHIAVDARRLWGFYAPRTGVGMIAPFFNHNQLSGFLNIGLLVAAGSTVSAEPVMPRMLSGAAVLGLAGMVVFLGSRGAVGSAVVGLMVAGALGWRSNRVMRKHGDLIVAAGVACAGVAMAAFASHDAAASNLQNSDFSKLLVTKACLVLMVPRYALFGAGRGSFESTFPEFRHDTGWFVFTHPENVVAQWTTEWGVPVAVAAFVACAVALRPRSAMARSRPAVGPFAALVALFLQNLVDFSSEFPGVVMALVVCAALVVGGSDSRARVKRPVFAVWSSRPRLTSCVLLAAVAVSAALTWPVRGHDVLADRARVLAGSDRGRDDAADVLDAIRAHPAEPYFPYVAAARAVRESSPHVVAWVNRALSRAPVYGPAHLVFARYLRVRAPAQARLEYRVAQEQSGVDVALPELASMVHGYYDALELAPSGAAGAKVLARLSVALDSRYPATSWRVDAEVLRRDPGQTDILARAANRRWSDVERGEPWCPACQADALLAAGALETAAPARCNGYLVRARVLVAQGRAPEGLAHLDAASKRVGDRTYCTEQLAQLAITTGDNDAASRAIERLAAQACAHPEDCAQNLMAAAELEGRRRSPHRALVYLRRAAEAAPGRDDVLAAEAATAESLGLRTEALDAYRKLLGRHPDDPRYTAAVARASATVYER